MSQFDWLVGAFPWTVFTVFDTETTGLEPKLNRVVEAGAIRFDSRGIAARFNTLINPKVPMPPEVTKINGITDAMLMKERDAAAALPDFIEFLGDTPIIAHNAPFDVAFINEELARLGKEPLKNRVIDTRIFAKEIFPSLQSYRLQDLAKRFNIEAIDAHRAEDDARVCMELFLVCLARLREMRPDLVKAAENPVEAPERDTAKSGATPGPADAESPRATVSAPVGSDPWQDDLFSGEEETDGFSEDEQE